MPFNWTQVKDALKAMKGYERPKYPHEIRDEAMANPNAPQPPVKEPFKPFVERIMEYDFGSRERPKYPHEIRDAAMGAEIPEPKMSFSPSFGSATSSNPKFDLSKATFTPASGGNAYAAPPPPGVTEPLTKQPAKQPIKPITAPTMPKTGSKYLDMYYAGRDAQEAYYKTLPPNRQPIEFVTGGFGKRYENVPDGSYTQTTRSYGSRDNQTQEVTRTAGTYRRLVDPGYVRREWVTVGGGTGMGRKTKLEAAFNVDHDQEMQRYRDLLGLKAEKAALNKITNPPKKVADVVKTTSTGPDGLPREDQTIVFDDGGTKAVTAGADPRALTSRVEEYEGMMQQGNHQEVYNQFQAMPVDEQTEIFSRMSSASRKRLLKLINDGLVK